MPYAIFLALVVFAFATAFTPGPNNILLAASGVNFGFARTIPHVLGVQFGFIALLTACTAGLGLAFAAVPALQIALKVAGGAYMLWLAWKVANAHNNDSVGRGAAQPFTFVQAAAFQLVNPKAAVVSLSAIAIYVRPGERFDAVVLVAVFAVSTILSAVTWAGFGVALRRVLQNPLRARIFNTAMALLLVASIVPMVW